MGEDRSVQLDVVPPKFRVIVTRRANTGSDGVVQAFGAGTPRRKRPAHCSPPI
ncbi:transposase (plasmid) [Sinorhizobium americanum CCGM7]|nr:transposase [Sinorhizobium americanum CCGM7]